MRLLRVDLDGSRFELHPYVSVLPGLDDTTRARLIDVVAGLAAGRAEAAGLIEAHGVLLDLTADTLALLDLVGAGPARDPVDVVVRAEQLPGGPVSPAARERLELLKQREAMVEEVQRAEAAAHRADLAHAASRASLGEREDVPAQVDDSLERARDELRRSTEELREAERRLAAVVELRDATRQQHDSAVASLEAARHERTELARRATAAAEALEVARGGRDLFAASALDAARERVAELERERERDRSDPGDEAVRGALADALESDVLTEKIAGLERQRQELEASLLSLDTADARTVEDVLSSLQGDTDWDAPVLSEVARTLAEEWAELEERLAAGVPGAPRDPTTIVEARRRLDSARIALFEAERAVRLPDISPEQAEALETAHDAVLDAQKRLARRFAGSSARTRLDEARHVEQQLLDSLGFLTYTDFVTGTSIGKMDPAKQDALERARQTLANAEAELAALEASVDAELALVELRNRQAVLRSRAVELLGHDPGDDVEWELRQLRVTQQDDARFDRLRRVLATTGVDISGEDVNGELLVELARAWLDEQRTTTSERERVESRLSELEAELSALRSGAADAERLESDRVDHELRVVERLAEARAVLEAAELRVERHARAEIAIAQAKVELQRATTEEQRATASLKRLEDAVTESAGALSSDERAVREAEAALRAASSVRERCATEVEDAEATRARASAPVDPASRERVVAETGAEAEERTIELKRTLAALAELDERIDALPDSGAADAAVGDSAEEVEWYLLSRVAAQRAVSYAGSVPIVLHDVFRSLPDESFESLLERLERMASAVQVVILSDDAPVGFWAERAGPERAAVIHAEAVSAD